MDPALIIPLILIFLLIIASAFFSAGETSLTAVSKAKIHKLKMSGDKRAILVSKLRVNKDRLIGALLLGNNAVNIMASAIATSAAIKLYGDDGVIYATFLMTVIVIIFAEVMPKTYAFYNAEHVALKIAPFLNIVIKILAPITDIVQITVNFMMKMLGVSQRESDMSFADEIRGAIELHHSEGNVDKRDRDMLSSILDLTETEVGEVMIHRKNMMTVNIEEPSSKIVSDVLGGNHTRIPVWKDSPENIVGIMHVKELLRSIRNHKGPIDKLDLHGVITKPWFVPDKNTLNNQLYQFRKKQQHMALVVNEYGDLVGLITLEDVLEEIVGQIYDEHDVVSAGIRRLKSGWIEVKGDVTLRDLNRAMDWSLPDDDATTIAGLVIHDAETIPDIGQEFKFHGCTFRVIKKKRNQITKLGIRKSDK